MNRLVFCLIMLSALNSCVPSKMIHYAGEIPSPDYANIDVWGAHPSKEDASDKIPAGLQPRKPFPEVDIFFLHPTTYTAKDRDIPWNGDIRDPELRTRTETTTLQFQASLFNRVGNVYAPFYRQAHLDAFFTNDKAKAEAAFEIAYADIRRAFQYYLDHHHREHPIILASHSQGTRHAERLMREFFDGKPLGAYLVAGYLVGLPVREKAFGSIPPCENATQTGCFVSWRTWKNGFAPPARPGDEQVVVTNPITWTRKGDTGPKTANTGAVLLDFDKVIPNVCDATCRGGYLEVSHPHFPWSFLFRRKNYHIADLNLFYDNVQVNARDRAAAFLLRRTTRNP